MQKMLTLGIASSLIKINVKTNNSWQQNKAIQQKDYCKWRQKYQY